MADIIDRLKIVLCTDKDADVARSLSVKPSKLSVWKVRNTVPIELITTFCIDNGVHLEWVLTGYGEMLRISDADDVREQNTPEITPDDWDDPDHRSAHRLLTKILDSGETVLVRAITANLWAFSETVDSQKREAAALELMVELKNKVDRLEKRMSDLEAENAALKRRNPGPRKKTGTGNLGE